LKEPALGRRDPHGVVLDDDSIESGGSVHSRMLGFA